MPIKPDVAAVMVEDALALMELDRRRWQNTGNPLYVWRAIGNCYSLGMLQRRVAGDDAPSTSPHPFPAWCLDYLRTVAFRMDALMDGKDFRAMPAPVGTGR